MGKLLPISPMTTKGAVNLETIEVLKALAVAHWSLAELKVYTEVVLNNNIVINALTLNESKDRSAIENIVTTHDELFGAMASDKNLFGPAKEVLNYKQAIWLSFGLTEKNDSYQQI